MLSQKGDKWSVKFDVWDLGHVDTNFWGWCATLATGVWLVIARFYFIFVLLLDFHGRVRVTRSMYIFAALYGTETFLLTFDSLRKLLSSIHRVVWSFRQSLTSVCALFFLMDGLTGCDLACCG